MSSQRGLHQAEANGELRLIDAWRALRADWPWLAGAVFTFAVAAVIFALVMVPVYRAQTTVTLVDADNGSAPASALLGQLGGVAGLAGVNLSGITGNSNKARVVLNSRTLIEEFIKRLDLVPVLFDEADASGGRNTLWRAVEAFKDIYEVNEDVQTGVITVRVEWTDAQLAAEWANQLVQLTNELLRQRDLADAQRNIEYLEKQLARTNVVGLQQVIYNLIEAEMKTLMLANVRDEYALTVIDAAVIPEMRARPKRKQLVALGVLFGAIVGVFLVAVRRAARTIREHEALLQTDA